MSFTEVNTENLKILLGYVRAQQEAGATVPPAVLRSTEALEGRLNFKEWLRRRESLTAAAK